MLGLRGQWQRRSSEVPVPLAPRLLPPASAGCSDHGSLHECVKRATQLRQLLLALPMAILLLVTVRSTLAPSTQGQKLGLRMVPGSCTMQHSGRTPRL